MKVMNIPELDGPYRPSRRTVILSFLAHAMAIVAIGFIAAVAVVGMTGALDEAQACVECQERIGK